MGAKRKAWCLAGIVMGLVACSTGSTVVLVPDPDGSVGRITVANDAGTVVIDQANNATVVRDSKTPPTAVEEKTPAEIARLFGPVIAHQPLAPMHVVLQFRSDSVSLLPASIRQLPDIVAAIEARSPTRVSVVGHTDTMGDKRYNLDLSLRRAEAVKAMLVDRGVLETAIEVTSHGEENPVVKTADNVANAQNRRVEVVIR